LGSLFVDTITSFGVLDGLLVLHVENSPFTQIVMYQTNATANLLNHGMYQPKDIAISVTTRYKAALYSIKVSGDVAVGG